MALFTCSELGTVCLWVDFTNETPNQNFKALTGNFTKSFKLSLLRLPITKFGLFSD